MDGRFILNCPRYFRIYLRKLKKQRNSFFVKASKSWNRSFQRGYVYMCWVNKFIIEGNYPEKRILGLERSICSGIDRSLELGNWNFAMKV